ncbi:MAG: hypothetical protein ACI90V_006752 [Bacillariaceae sp.]|jgi:hypothetical protein
MGRVLVLYKGNKTFEKETTLLIGRYSNCVLQNGTPTTTVH